MNTRVIGALAISGLMVAMAAGDASAATRSGSAGCPAIKYGDLRAQVSGTGSASLSHSPSGWFEAIGYAFGSNTNSANINNVYSGGTSSFYVSTNGVISSAGIACNY